MKQLVATTARRKRVKPQRPVDAQGSHVVFVGIQRHGRAPAGSSPLDREFHQRTPHTALAGGGLDKQVFQRGVGARGPEGMAKPQQHGKRLGNPY